MPRRVKRIALLSAFYLPWIVLWWCFTDPGLERGPSVTALYMILTICTVAMVLMPMFLGGIAGKRWLLISLLGVVNLFWCLRWIEIFAESTPPGLRYATARRDIVMYMALSSLLVVLIYRVAENLLRQFGRRRRITPG